MQEQILTRWLLGAIVYHKSAPEVAMVITKLGKDGCECCFYNRVTGSFENALFGNHELFN